MHLVIAQPESFLLILSSDGGRKAESKQFPAMNSVSESNRQLKLVMIAGGVVLGGRAESGWPTRCCGRSACVAGATQRDLMAGVQ